MHTSSWKVRMVCSMVILVAVGCGGYDVDAFCAGYRNLARTLDATYSTWDQARGELLEAHPAAVGSEPTRAQRAVVSVTSRLVAAADEARVAAPDEIKPELNELWRTSARVNRLARSLREGDATGEAHAAIVSGMDTISELGFRGATFAEMECGRLIGP